jgi:hypothetical protein
VARLLEKNPQFEAAILALVAGAPEMGPIGKAVRIGRGRAAVTGDDRRNDATVGLWTPDGKARRKVFGGGRNVLAMLRRQP